MKKILIVLLITTTLITGCTAGNKIETDIDNPSEYQVLINNASLYVVTFKDPKTDVWYIKSSEGVTPRLNADGSLYVEE
jgi:hypothetical protein